MAFFLYNPRKILTLFILPILKKCSSPNDFIWRLHQISIWQCFLRSPFFARLWNYSMNTKTNIAKEKVALFCKIYTQIQLKSESVHIFLHSIILVIYIYIFDEKILFSYRKKMITLFLWNLNSAVIYVCLKCVWYNSPEIWNV